jgi:hypothetical protein
MKMRNSLILLVICASLTACADRERLNCPPIKNKALTAVTETTSAETTTAPRYATGAKCR